MFSPVAYDYFIISYFKYENQFLINEYKTRIIAIRSFGIELKLIEN